VEKTLRKLEILDLTCEGLEGRIIVVDIIFKPIALVSEKIIEFLWVISAGLQPPLTSNHTPVYFSLST
jgi:hypothetical protein